MWPVLFNFGPFGLKTIAVFNILAFLTTAFVIWRKSREEHYQERQLFDGFLLALVFGGLVARLAFIVVNFSRFQGSFLAWFDLINHSGYLLNFGILGAGFYLFRFAQKHKWDPYEVVDFGATAAALGLFWLQLGYFFNGSGFGQPTTLPWGLVFPGVIQKYHPVQLYLAVFYLLLYFYLTWVEYRYRTFEWYRAGKKSAQTGFVFLNFLIGLALIQLGLTPVKLAELNLGGFSLDIGFYLVLLILSLGWLWLRSGRELLPTKRKKLNVK
ncbi:MAG: hypothetical protein GF390_02675 [Candidatus Pacebacteria bacterium]|nr:hypothetical protein [Candidatus Paceibacterota bacterium]